VKTILEIYEFRTDAAVKLRAGGDHSVRTFLLNYVVALSEANLWGLTHKGAYIWSYNFQDGAPAGIHGTNADVYLYPHTQLDAQVSYLLPRGRGLRLIASFLNLNKRGVRLLHRGRALSHPA
jgi:hypothetical protein